MTIERITTLREQITTTQEELEGISKTTWIPLAEAAGRLREWVGFMAEQVGPVGVHNFALPHANPRGLGALLDGDTRAGHLTAVLCWLWLERVFEQLNTALEARYATSDRTVLSETDRSARIAQLEAELLALECEEEQLIRALEDAGQQALVRRGDIHHLAVVLAD